MVVGIKRSLGMVTKSVMAVVVKVAGLQRTG